MNSLVDCGIIQNGVIKVTIGERIREARKNAGLTQAQLAESSGVAAISIHQYEAGKREPRIEQLCRVADTLGVSIQYLLGSEDSKGFLLPDDFADPDDFEFVKALGLDDPKVRHVRASINEAIEYINLFNSLTPDVVAKLANLSGVEVDEMRCAVEELENLVTAMIYNLNERGKQKVLDYAKDLANIPEYQRKLPDEDAH